MASARFRFFFPAMLTRSANWPWKSLMGGTLVASGVASLSYLKSDLKFDERGWLENIISFPRIYAAVRAKSENEETDAPAKEANSDEITNDKNRKKAIRGRRMRRKFTAYASKSFNGTSYMTPEDFVLALVEAPSLVSESGAQAMSETELKKMLKNTPDLKKNSTKLFQSLGNQGLISFPEFVFLLVALSRSERNFKIGFMMLDEDASGKIDLPEFTQLTELIGHEYAGDELVLQKENEDQSKAAKTSTPSTTLTYHLFGSNGRGLLGYDQFKQFVDNLWQELVEIEYDRLADPTTKEISVIDFGRIVLRYTHLDDIEQAAYLNRLRHKAKESVSFDEFKQFNKFVSHLDDFRLAMRMYSIAEVSVSQEELARAVLVSSGVKFSAGILELIMSVFDRDDDEKLSYREFVSVLHGRLDRSLRSVGAQSELEKLGVWMQWKKCVRQEFRRTV